MPSILFVCVANSCRSQMAEAVAARERIDWDLPDPVGLSRDDARAVRDEIVQRVRRLFGKDRLP